MSLYSLSDVPEQSGRTFFVTGANTGIGFEAARALAGRGARVLLGCRSPDKAKDALARIVAEHPKADVDFVPLDLGDLSSVEAAAATVAAESRLDVLVNNAGIMMPPRALTQDGFESQFGVNHLGHFALTARLLPKLIAQEGSRVVTVSSLAHIRGRIDWEDVHAERSYSRQARYGMSKLANLLFTFELQRRLEAAGAPTLAVACHPGATKTDLSRHMPKLLISTFQVLAGWLMNSPPEGALPTLRAATDPEVRGGDYYGPAKRGGTARSAVKVQARPHAHDEADARRLWDLSVELTGVEPSFG